MEEVKRIKYRAEESVVLLQQWFHRKACFMSGENRSVTEDLMQEMSMAVLCCNGEHPLLYYKKVGITRAKTFLRTEARQKLRRSRFARLRQPVIHSGEIRFIESMIDLQSLIQGQSPVTTLLPEVCNDLRNTA